MTNQQKAYDKINSIIDAIARYEQPRLNFQSRGSSDTSYNSELFTLYRENTQLTTDFYDGIMAFMKGQLEVLQRLEKR